MNNSAWSRAAVLRKLCLPSAPKLSQDESITHAKIRPDRTYGDSGDFSPLTVGRCINPIRIRGANYAHHICFSPLDLKWFPMDLKIQNGGGWKWLELQPIVMEKPSGTHGNLNGIAAHPLIRHYRITRCTSTVQAPS